MNKRSWLAILWTVDICVCIFIFIGGKIRWIKFLCFFYSFSLFRLSLYCWQCVYVHKRWKFEHNVRDWRRSKIVAHWVVHGFIFCKRWRIGHYYYHWFDFDSTAMNARSVLFSVRSMCILLKAFGWFCSFDFCSFHFAGWWVSVCVSIQEQQPINIPMGVYQQ